MGKVISINSHQTMADITGYPRVKEYLMDLMATIPTMPLEVIAENLERLQGSYERNSQAGMKALCRIGLKALQDEVKQRMSDQDNGIRRRDKEMKAEISKCLDQTAEESVAFWQEVNRYVPEDEQLQR